MIYRSADRALIIIKRAKSFESIYSLEYIICTFKNCFTFIGSYWSFFNEKFIVCNLFGPPLRISSSNLLFKPLRNRGRNYLLEDERFNQSLILNISKFLTSKLSLFQSTPFAKWSLRQWKRCSLTSYESYPYCRVMYRSAGFSPKRQKKHTNLTSFLKRFLLKSFQ